MAEIPASLAKEMPKVLKGKQVHTFDPSKEVPPQTGKVFVITGANTGIGKQAAIELSRHSPAQIWITSRNAERGQAALQDIKAASPDVDARLVELDLESFDSIKLAAKKITTEADRLDVLLLNAGMMGGPAGTTKDGYERNFGVNCLGHALLHKLLTPLLLQTASSSGVKPRVITLGSKGHSTGLPDGGILFDGLKTSQEDLPGFKHYTQSKLAAVVYARQLAKHYPEIISVAINPGEVFTELFSKAKDGGGPEIAYMADVLIHDLGTTVEEGAKNSIWAATNDNVETGRYYDPIGVTGGGSELSKDAEFGDKVWGWVQKELEGHSS